MLLLQSRVEMKRWDLIEQQKGFLKENHEARRSGSLFLLSDSQTKTSYNDYCHLFTHRESLLHYFFVFLFWVILFLGNNWFPTPKFNTN